GGGRLVRCGYPAAGSPSGARGCLRPPHRLLVRRSRPRLGGGMARRGLGPRHRPAAPPRPRLHPPLRPPVLRLPRHRRLEAGPAG
ncbi:MAG: hypothetical protein AVDCRST_MAG18-4226, partial [uncultured Thermomicrobiales bacterium]